MSEKKEVRVRFAPSPTGPLHIGGVRTALYNYLFSKKYGGSIILRIEDTDSHRFVPGAEKYIIDALKWLGITFNEGVETGGTYGPYRQSERKEIYKKYAGRLIDEDKAYIAFDTPEELESKHKEIKNFQYDASTRLQMRNSLTLSKEEVDRNIKNGEKYVVRFKIEPDKDIIVNDIIRGEVKINSSILDDKVIYKSADSLPTYHLANIVDDHLMKITHVIRGEEWLPSAPLHVLLYKAFGWEDSMPEFAHLPLLLKPEGNGKLSKRDGDRLGFPVFPCDWTDPKTGDKSSGYREAGYFPEAVVNFLALLGWNPGTEQEIFSMDELIDTFDIKKCSKSGAKFDYEKAKWFNHHYLTEKPTKELLTPFRKILEEKGITIDEENIAPAFEEKKSTVSVKYIEEVTELIKNRANFIKDLWNQSYYFFIRPEEYDKKGVKKFWKENTKDLISELIEQLENLENFDPKFAEDKICEWINSKGYKLGAVLNALRVSLVGAAKGPHIFDITYMLGKQETIYRAKKAIEILK